jgi:hypothetical protein
MHRDDSTLAAAGAPGRTPTGTYPRITMRSGNAAHRPTAMIAKDLILTKDPNRISA